jgi:translation initiation factor 2-alpha kinase 4
MQQRESTTRGGDAALLERSISGWGAGGRWGDAVSDVLVGDGGVWEPGGTDSWAAALASTPRGSSIAVRPRASLGAALIAASAAKPSPPGGAAGSRLLLREDASDAAQAPSSSHAGAVLEAVTHARGMRFADGDDDDASLNSTGAAALLARAAALADSTRGVADLRIKHDESDEEDSDEEEEEDEDEDSDESDESEEEEEEDEAGGAGDIRTGGRALRQALLTGHLLALLTAPRGPLPHALPALARELQAAGLLPRWLRDLLMRRPALFDRAFRGTFNANARARAAAAAPSGDPAGRWALTRFWSAHTAGDAAAAAGGPQQEAISRYRADFEELSALGRGSFGQVVLGVNRLDGRKYAIKKIALARDVTLNSKILREVATLSRLEHASVVRYYQAWTEVSTGDSSGEESRETTGGGEEDDDDEEDSSDWRSSSVGPKAPAAARGKPSGEQRYLYIQMEYCRTTMREVLDSGVAVDVEQAWIWIRQILEGLSHVHAQGITHRDLKPSNLFLDAQGRVRIGDFGLAKFASSAAGGGGGDDDDADGPALLPPGEGSSTLLPADSEPSGAVGTFLYTAPEVARGLPHDCKVDLYALGVIAFEMLRRFGSGMQRVVELSELRTAQRLPAGFATSFPMQAALIESLVQVDPAARPSAAEALQSGALPPRVGDEHLGELLRSLGESGATYDAVVHRVFTADSAGARAAARGAQLEADVLAASAAASAEAASSSPPDAALTSAVERVATSLRTVFKRHGGEPCYGSRGLAFASPPPPAPGGVHVLDPSGALLGLRDELRGRFVASLAAHAAAGAPPPALLRRYELASVVRAAPGAPLPREVLQADFDLIGPAEAPPGAGGAAAGVDSFDSGVAACDAEAMKVAVDVADAVGLSRGAAVLVSHRELLSAVWRAAGVPSEARGRAAALLRAAPPPPPPGLAPQAVAAAAIARDAAWQALRGQLCDGLGLAPHVAERLEAIHRVGGEPSAALPHLRGVLRAASGSRAAAALDALAAATSLLSAMGVSEGVAIAPLLAPAEPYWSGIFFELHAHPRGGASVSTSTTMAVLAAGGRYDALLTAQWPPGADGGPPGGVGVSFSATRLASLLGTPPSSSALDVLVAARGGGGLLRARLELTSALWAAGVRAETLPQAAPSLTEQFAHATRRAARWLLIISDAPAVRVKHLSGVGRAAGREEDVPRGDVVRHMLALVAAGSTLERGGSGSASAADLGADIARAHARRSSAPSGEELAAEAEALSDAGDDTGRKERGGRRRRYAPNAERRDERRDARAFTAE